MTKSRFPRPFMILAVMALVSALVISLSSPVAAQVEDPPTEDETQDDTDESDDTDEPDTDESDDTDEPDTDTVRVTVVRGDNLWKLARIHLGSGLRWSEIYALNEGITQADGRALTNPDLILIGWVLELPPLSV